MLNTLSGVLSGVIEPEAIRDQHDARLHYKLCSEFFFFKPEFILKKKKIKATLEHQKTTVKNPQRSNLNTTLFKLHYIIFFLCYLLSNTNLNLSIFKNATTKFFFS